MARAKCERAARGRLEGRGKRAVGGAVACDKRIALGLCEVPSARVIAKMDGVSCTFAGNQLSTVDSWRAATERTGADGKVRVLPPVHGRKSEVLAAGTVDEMCGVSHTCAGNQLATVATWRDARERTGADGKTRSLPPPVRRDANKRWAIKMA